LAVLIAGVIAGLKQSRKSASGMKATGTVVNLVSRVFNPGSVGVYCPVVEFTSATGQRVRFESQFGTMPASHHLGQTIAVRYDPADPQKAEVDSATANWFVPGARLPWDLGFC
jgi:hypothetical protein